MISGGTCPGAGESCCECMETRCSGYDSARDAAEVVKARTRTMDHHDGSIDKSTVDEVGNKLGISGKHKISWESSNKPSPTGEFTWLASSILTQRFLNVSPSAEMIRLFVRAYTI